MSTKRARTDGQIHKDEYEDEDGVWSPTRSSPMGGGGQWQRATPNTLAQRKIVKAKKVDRRQEYLAAVQKLNGRFQRWVADRVAKDPTASLLENVQEYLSYVQQLEMRYLRKEGEVLVFGSSECGQCDPNEPIIGYPKPVAPLRRVTVCSVSCGALHNVAITTEGKVYTWGSNDEGALGRDGEEALPILVEKIAHEVVMAGAAGDCHSTVVTLQGAVYTWGSYKDKDGKSWCQGPTPRDSYDKTNREPILIPRLKAVATVACGASHNVATLLDGSVVSWGIGDSGQLGRRIDISLFDVDPLKKDDKGKRNIIRVFTDHLTPARMEMESGETVLGVRAIGCGGHHTLVVRALNSEVFSCGLNNYGQLGNGQCQNEPQRLLKKVDALDGMGITQVAGGAYHSLAVSGPTGKVYSWGRADMGQLGITDFRPSPGSFEAIPVEITMPPTKKGKASFVHSVAAGGQHTLITTVANEVFTCGFGEMSALGHKGFETDEYRPRRIDFSKSKIDALEVLGAAGGSQHSVIVAKVVKARYNT